MAAQLLRDLYGTVDEKRRLGGNMRQVFVGELRGPNRRSVSLPGFREKIRVGEVEMNTYGKLLDAFEKYGGCGHDLPIKALAALINEWECIRSAGSWRDLKEAAGVEFE
jgi:hypothetical protein